MKKLLTSPESFCFGLLLLLAAFIALAAGCKSGQTFIEGTRFRMGIYVPWDGQLYGLQFCEYLNGTALLSPSNSNIEVQRTFASTNSYFGIVNTVDSSNTRAKTAGK